MNKSIKNWVELNIFTEGEQIIKLKPNEEMDSIVLQIEELDEKESTRLYLSLEEVDLLLYELKLYKDKFL